MADAPDGLRQALADRYAIERELGAGGMATVYLAADLKHPRKVAIKILRPEVAAVVGAERFVQEIRVTAALQHPHILGLIDSGVVETERGALPYYVMPFVDGESLRDKLRRETHLTIDEAVTITTAVASALDYAHRHGVIHRDIKPENILLHEGQALVADFGIALALQTAGGTRLTDTGLALGTPQYMSPEQGLAHREVGPRSDVYALGCVVYEMLAGEPPFTGPTAQAIIAKAARDTPPPLRVGRPSVPLQIDAAVSKALAKLPADRFASGAELVRALEDTEVATTTPAALPGIVSRYRRVVAVLAALLLVAAGALTWLWLRPATGVQQVGVKRFDITLPPDVPPKENFGSRIALAPDGKSFVYLAIADGIRRLFLRPIDQTTARLLPGSEGASVPFYSPDSKWVGFLAQGQMKKVAIGGGDAVFIGQVPGVLTGAAWGDRGVIAFTSFTDKSLWQLAAEGGKPQLIIRPDTSKGELFLTHPAFLPGGDALVVDRVHGDLAELIVVRLQTGRAVPLPLHGCCVRGAQGDTILFSQPDYSLAAVRLDLAKLQVVGLPAPLHVQPTVTLESPEFASSREGTLIFLPEASDPTTLVLVDRHGVARPLVSEAQEFGTPRFSPDGTRVAVTGHQGIWIYGVADRTASRLTFTGEAYFAIWTPDGRKIAYHYERGDTFGVFWTNSDGAGTPRSLMLTPHGPALFPRTWTRDGRSLVAEDQEMRLWVVPTDSALKLRLLEDVRHQEYNPALSPDGHWLAFASNESGQWEVYVQSFPGLSGRAQVSLNGGVMPVWNRTGTELFYRSGNRLYVASVAAEPGFHVTDRQMLFDSPRLRSVDASRDYDVSPDGQHFVMLQRNEPLEKLVVVLNWSGDVPQNKSQ
jgi:serine/threonine-protein kinase